MTEVLAACPFCGTRQHVRLVQNGPLYSVDCYQCETSGPSATDGSWNNTPGDAIRGWNRIGQALQAAGRREALEECLDAIDRVRKADFGDRRDTASALGAIRAVEVAIRALIGEKENLTKEK